MDASLFSWSSKNGGDPADSVVADSQTETPSGGVAHHQMSASAIAAKTAADASPRKRGRPRADGSAGSTNSRTLQAQIDSQIATQLDALHDPEAWGALLALPGDAALAITGRERWEIRKEERRTLGVTGSAFARTMMITNPRALAAMMLAAAMFSVYGTRAIAEMKELRDKKQAEPKATESAKV